jgi:large subunit ribosomal protein L22
VMKIFRPRAKGRASPIKKPFSRITIVLAEKKEIKKNKDKVLSEKKEIITNKDKK